MKKAVFWTLSAVLLLTALVLCACAGQGADAPDSGTTDGGEETDVLDTPAFPMPEVTIHPITDFNMTEEVDSHKGDTYNSTLEFDYRAMSILDAGTAGSATVFYPRIRQMANGEYLMTYQNQKTGNSIYAARSADLRTWRGVTRLFDKSETKVSFYATAEPCVLQNGDVIVVTSFNQSYNGNPLTNGLVMKRSTDNGLTWSEETVIYRGTTWEPSILQLASGEIQVYFTNTHVKGVSASLGGRKDDNSTGTGMIRSLDNGVTWSSDLSKAYGCQIVAQQKSKTGSDGNYYTGQMPVAIQLHDGSIALALEARVPGSKGDTYNASFAYSADNWATSLGADEEGPSTLSKNRFLKKAGPYLRQFLSGETVLTYHWSGAFQFMMGDAAAKTFNFATDVFKGTKIAQWGSLEITDTHTLLAVVPNANNDGIYIGTMRLDHTIAAAQVTVTPDGYTDEWRDVADAFFVGSESQAQMSLRVACDGENLYFCADVLDEAITDGDKVDFQFAAPDGKVTHVFVGANGQMSLADKEGNALGSDGFCASAAIIGTLGDDKDTDEGYVIELSVPLSYIGQDCDLLSVNPTLYNSDRDGAEPTKDTAGGIPDTAVARWLHVTLK